MPAAAMTAGVTSSTARVTSSEMFPAAKRTLRRMPATSHAEAARAPAANALGLVPVAKQMKATRARRLFGGASEVPARESSRRSFPEFSVLKT